MDKGKKNNVGFMILNSTSFNIIRSKDIIESFSYGEKGQVHRSSLNGEDSRVFSSNGMLHLVYNTHFTKFKKIYFAPLYYDVKLDSYHTNDPGLFYTSINI